MSTQNDTSSNDIYICLTDVVAILRRAHKTILAVAVLFAFLSGVYFLMREPYYSVSGTYFNASTDYSGAEGGSAAGAANSVFSSLLSGGAASTARQGLILIQSKMIAARVVEKLRLQADVEDMRYTRGIKRRAIFENLAAWRGRAMPDYREQPLGFYDIERSGYEVRYMSCSFSDDEHFVITHNGTSVKGVLGELVAINGMKFRLFNRYLGESLKGRDFAVRLGTSHYAANRLSSMVTIEPDMAFDNGVVCFRSEMRDRFFATELINTYMDVFTEYLEEKAISSFEKDLEYFGKKREEAVAKLSQLVYEDMSAMKNSLEASDFMPLEDQVEHLLRKQEEYNAKRDAIVREIERVKNYISNDVPYYKIAYYPSHQLHESSEPIVNRFTGITSQLNKLVQEKDLLARALDLRRADDENEAVLAGGIQHIILNRQLMSQTEKILHKVRQDAPINLAEYPHLISQLHVIPLWLERVQKCRLCVQSAVDQSQAMLWNEQLSLEKTSFINYLEKLIDKSRVKGMFYEERSAFVTRTFDEYDGRTYAILKDMYANQLSLIDDLRIERDEIVQALAASRDEKWQIAPLAELDVIRANEHLSALISKYSITEDRLIDATSYGRSEKEKLTRASLEQRKLIARHLIQQKQRIDESLAQSQAGLERLQEQMLDRVLCEISIANDEMEGFFHSVIEMRSDELRALDDARLNWLMKIQGLPEKWVKEHQMGLHKELYTDMVQELTHLTESRRIMSNVLTKVSSGPIDRAVPAIYPHVPRLQLYIPFGFCMGLFFASCGALFYGVVVRGMLASEENLKVAHQCVLGSLSREYTSGIRQGAKEAEVFGHMITVLRNVKKADACVVGLFHGPSGYAYENELIARMVVSGAKMCWLDLEAHVDEHAGLADFLQEKTDVLPTMMRACGRVSVRYLPFGGDFTYAHELISSPRFDSTLRQLRLEYDFIIVTVRTAVDSAFSRAVAHWCDAQIFNASHIEFRRIQAAFGSNASFVFEAA